MSCPPEWHSCGSVERWRDHLLHLVGCSAAETSRKIGLLLRFCADEGISPDSIVEQCRSAPDKLRLRELYSNKARESGAELLFQSFLIHNGINTFGELICLPDTTEKVVKEQGKNWNRHWQF
jgi:hypothetical protein